MKKKCTKDRLGADMSGAGEESLDANQTMAASAAHNQTGTRQRGPGLPQEADLTTPWPPTCTRQEMWHPDPSQRGDFSVLQF